MIKTRKDKREFGETTHKARKRKAASFANLHFHQDDSDDAFQPAVKKRRLASPAAVASTSKSSGRASKRSTGSRPTNRNNAPPATIEVSPKAVVRAALNHLEDDMVD